jgi:hypothetical protein
MSAYELEPVKGGGNVEEEPVVVKKAGSPTDISVSGVGRRVEEGTATKSDVYDPSKESRWTRIGLNAESFKRAPGTTAGQVVHGDVPPEFLGHDNPLLQQKLKPRHLTMIAVGMSKSHGPPLTTQAARSAQDCSWVPDQRSLQEVQPPSCWLGY